MSVMRVSVKGQVVIPADLRKKYRISPKDKVLVSDGEGQIVVVPLLENPVRQARGILKGEGLLTRALLKFRKEELDREEKDIHPG